MDNPSKSARPDAIFGKGIWFVPVWIGLGLVFYLLNLLAGSQIRSPYWFSELVLYALLLIGLWANRRYNIRKVISLPRQWAPVLYIFLVWLFGMLFEASLTVTGQGIGGVHPQTLASFILAQGDYLPLAIVSWWVIRKLHPAFSELYFFSAGISLTEGLIFTGALTAMILSPQFFLAPFGLAYYALAYSSFIALPLLIIDEGLLWDARQVKPYPVPLYWLLGFGIAILVRLFWGLVYSPLVARLFDLPPNILVVH